MQTQLTVVSVVELIDLFHLYQWYICWRLPDYLGWLGMALLLTWYFMGVAVLFTLKFLHSIGVAVLSTLRFLVAVVGRGGYSYRATSLGNWLGSGILLFRPVKINVLFLICAHIYFGAYEKKSNCVHDFVLKIKLVSYVGCSVNTSSRSASPWSFNFAHKYDLLNYSHVTTWTNWASTVKWTSTVNSTSKRTCQHIVWLGELK